ncbi:MAG: OmpA family protein, partial [Cyclobacteriaceae bacterium]|nr:OmpA family protein [Cyclobacteriaceae bacterium]
REDTYGDRDLYVSFLKEDSTWTEPLNLGDMINTANVEGSPFLAADDQTLYFSSNGFSGYGGMDVYVSTRLDDTWTNWSEPRNMGPQVNSKFEDVFFNVPASSEFAYYSRGISDDDTDIFRIALPLFQIPEPTIVVKGKMLNAINEDPIFGVVNYERISDGKAIGIIQSNPQTGEYELILPAGENYSLKAEAEGYLPESKELDLSEVKKAEDQPRNLDIRMNPEKKEVVMVLNTVLFDFDKATLKKESFAELDRLTEFVQNNPPIRIEIAGHTDNVGSANYNMELSKRRAQSVAKYLRSKGIQNERMEIVYFGETKPLESNETNEGRGKNRRVEFKILNN